MVEPPHKGVNEGVTKMRAVNSQIREGNKAVKVRI